MGYNQLYNKVLQDRKPFQIAKSEEIRKRNLSFLIQEQRLKETMQKRVLKSAEEFINKVCKLN
jgi:hypothetical protein